jgi:hypothetical protein
MEIVIQNPHHVSAKKRGDKGGGTILIIRAPFIRRICRRDIL